MRCALCQPPTSSAPRCVSRSKTTTRAAGSAGAVAAAPRAGRVRARSRARPAAPGCGRRAAGRARRAAPALSIGRLPFPHCGECTQPGQPFSHAQSRIRSRVASSSASMRSNRPAARPTPACVPVVQEDRRAPELRVATVRDAADVEAVAEREQREQRERGVLDGVERAHHMALGVLERLRDLVGQLEPERSGLERGGRQLERLGAEQLLAAHAAPLVAGDARRDLHAALTEPEVPGWARALARQDARLLLGEGARVGRCRRRARRRPCAPRGRTA